MAIYRFTSDPKRSTKLHGWYYAYYNKPTPRGGECVALFPPVLLGIVKKGFAFDESNIHWDDTLKGSVLSLDFNGLGEVGDPSLPPDPETGWADPDGLPPTPAANVRQLHTEPPRAGVRPAALRRREAAELNPDTSKLPAALAKTGIEIGRLFLMEYALLSSIPESSRALIAQKLATTAAITYYRSAGVNLTEEDIQGISVA